VTSVLVVDDDLNILSAIAGALADEGLIVQTAPNGPRALDLIEEMQPDLLILDVTLPSQDSAMVARRMRDVRGANAPVLVITADGRAAEKARTLQAYSYLRKPFDLGRLIATVMDGLAQP
jgi:two-component system OmpR family response regulator